MKEYITEINTFLPYADIDLLDLVLQILQKSVEMPGNIIPSKEHPQSAWHLQAVQALVCQGSQLKKENLHSFLI